MLTEMISVTNGGGGGIGAIKLLADQSANITNLSIAADVPFYKDITASNIIINMGKGSKRLYSNGYGTSPKGTLVSRFIPATVTYDPSTGVLNVTAPQGYYSTNATSGYVTLTYDVYVAKQIITS